MELAFGDYHNVYWKPVLNELENLKRLYPSGIAEHNCSLKKQSI